MLCHYLFPNGKKVGNEWRIADVTGAKGNSLGIRLTGDKAGRWHDWATGERGDFVALVKARLGVGFLNAVEWIQGTGGVSLQSPETVRGITPPEPASIAREPAPILSAIQLQRMARRAHGLAARPALIFDVLGERREFALQAIRNSALEGDIGYESDCRWGNLSGPAILFGYSRGIKARWRQTPQGERPIRWICGGPGGECWRQSLLRRGHCAHRRVYMTEGETDALSVLSLGLEDEDKESLVVGLPGANILPERRSTVWRSLSCRTLMMPGNGRRKNLRPFWGQSFAESLSRKEASKVGKGDLSEQARKDPELTKKRLLGAKCEPYQPPAGGGPDGREASSLPAKPYPVLDAAAYYGIFGRIAKTIKPHRG